MENPEFIVMIDETSEDVVYTVLRWYPEKSAYRYFADTDYWLRANAIVCAMTAYMNEMKENV